MPTVSVRPAHALPVRLLLTAILVSNAAAFPASAQKAVDHVILISVDGLRPDAVSIDGRQDLPNFRRLIHEGAFTLNARTDFDYTVTLPNHVTQVTGRGVAGPDGHGWTRNGSPSEGETLHTNAEQYVASVFDVVHDSGRSTAIYASKSKFSLLAASYGYEGESGGGQLGRYHYDRSTSALMDTFRTQMKRTPPSFALLHLRDPDTAGHTHGWGSDAYQTAVARVDSLLGHVLDLASAPPFAGSTVIIVTSDHGGDETGHSDRTRAINFTIPFFTWGTEVEPGADLYALNEATRSDPGDMRPSYEAPWQPIRNGDAANLASSLLGLGPVPGSTINRAQDLRLTASDEAASDSPTTGGKEGAPGGETGTDREDDAFEPGWQASMNASALDPNHPNPFSASTTITFRQMAPGHVALRVYSLVGQTVATLAEGFLSPGTYSVSWDGTDAAGRQIPSGVYLYRLEGADQRSARVMTIIR